MKKGGSMEGPTKKVTPSAIRKKKNAQRARKGLQRKLKSKKPSWMAAMKKTYRHNPEKDEKAENDDMGVAEIQEEISEEKVNEMNKVQPLETQLFVKGLPAEASREEVENFFKVFGKVKRVLLVENKVTKRNAGTAFIHFSDKTGAEKTFSHAQQNAREAAAQSRNEMLDRTKNLSHHKAKSLQYKLHSQQQGEEKDPFIHFNNTRVFIYRAMSRIESQDQVSMAKKKKNRTKVAADDPRNLYLLQEGLIEEGTPAAAGLPPQYLEMLRADYDQRKQQLKNTTMFVSKTRLSIRNLPRKVEDKELRQLCNKHARAYLKKHPDDLDRENFGKYGPIKNLKLLLDTSGVSKGYAFVEFVNHNVALHVLRNLNNNPELFGPRQRLVVNFAIENTNALQKLARIREKKKMQLTSH